MDLSRMNRIIDYDEELAYVTVEPGVTQRQLYEFLQQRNSRLWMDVTGASPECSLIGNAMERGFGHTPYGDHFAHTCGLEVVLPDGEVIETGMSRFSGSTTAPVYRWGVGPSLDGLFSQSNLGVVTRMTVWLMPEPEYFQAFFFSCDASEDLDAIIDSLRPLRLNGTLRSSIHIGNDYKVLCGLQQYPWEETRGETPLGPEALETLAKRLRFGKWNGSGGLYGTKAQVAEARRLVRKALKGNVAKLQFLDDRTLEFAGKFAKPYSWIAGWDLSKALDLVRPVYGLMKGIPTDAPLRSAYWRKRTPPPVQMDPDRDGCGLLWCSPLAPMEGRHAAAVDRITSEVVLAHGFEPMISITLVNDRSIASVISISYDRSVPGEDSRALACYRELLETLASNGYYSYRLGIQSMTSATGQRNYTRLLQSLKDALDPAGVLAPGRYLPQRAKAASGD
jgi:4-cresol dehydrogenase (hydroxylating)